MLYIQGYKKSELLFILDINFYGTPVIEYLSLKLNFLNFNNLIRGWMKVLPAAELSKYGEKTHFQGVSDICI